jgi:hypothetical protein
MSSWGGKCRRPPRTGEEPSTSKNRLGFTQSLREEFETVAAIPEINSAPTFRFRAPYGE